ncbi:MAG TPA: hypothetical protein VL500_04360 [Candidatus Eisenbacteria bacterium]|jgi:hypothetical protein|nr:hypothetical protein [Candidatus Eisenbacteria bacterium]
MPERWPIRLAYASAFFTLFLYATPAIYAAVTEAQLTAAMRSRGWDRGLVYGDGGAVHRICNTDADCPQTGNNPMKCKTLTITYGSGSGPGRATAPPYVTKRCEASHCPSPFSMFLANGNPTRSVDDLADILQRRGAESAITIPVPSPAVNPWDPNYTRCKQMEATTSAGCVL